MSWARFDDGYLENPKVEAAGPLAEHLDMRGIIYCARNETDGRVTKSALRRLSFGLSRVEQRVNALVQSGRWTVHPNGGWLIHDFLEYNPSKAQKNADRAKARERMANVRANRGRSSDEVRSTSRGGRDGNTKEQGVGDPECERCQGRGTYWNGAGGFDVDCQCTKSLRVVGDA